MQNEIYPMVHSAFIHTSMWSRSLWDWFCGIEQQQQQSKLLKAEIGKETEKSTHISELFAGGSCVLQLTSLQQTIHCFWTVSDYSETAFMASPELMCKCPSQNQDGGRHHLTLEEVDI